MAESYEVVERFSQPAVLSTAQQREEEVRKALSAAASTTSITGAAAPAASATPRPGSSRARERTVSPAPSHRQRQVSNAPSSPASVSAPSVSHTAAAPTPGKTTLSHSQRIANLIQRQYIYFTTLLQEPEPKWKPVTDARGVTVSQLDSIDRNLVVYRAEATFVGVAVWDLFAAISTPGVRKAWEPNADDDHLLEEVRLPEREAGNEPGGALARQQGGNDGAPQMGNNSRSGLSRRTANGPPSQLWHLKQKAAWPVAARDSVLLSTTYRSQDCSSVHHFSFSTSDRGLFSSIPPSTQGTIRSQVDLRGWSIEALNPSTAHVTLIEQSDPKGWTTKSSSIPNAMVNAVAGVGAWAIKYGGPPVVTHLSVGAKQVVAKYEPDKGRYRLEYELDRSVANDSGEPSDTKPNTGIPPVIECELRCDLDLWSPNLDLIIDPPPIHVSVLRRAKLSRNGAGGGLWLTIEHASASLGALNSGDDEDDGMADDVARITVRRGDGITSETGVVLINGARMTVEVEEMDEEATKATLTRSQRSKPKRAPLDTLRQPTSADALESAAPIRISTSPATLVTLSAPVTFEGGMPGSDSKTSFDLDEDISQALAEHVGGAAATAVAADQASASSLGSKEDATATSPNLTSPPSASAVPATISRSGSPGSRPKRATSVREANSAVGASDPAKAIAVPGRASPRISDRAQGTLRERDRNRDRDLDSYSMFPTSSTGTTSALSTSLSASSPMMNVLSRINAGSSATSSITNTQASGQLRIASGVEPPSRSPTVDSSMSRTGSGEGGRAGAGAGATAAPTAEGAASDKDKRATTVTGKSNEMSTSKSNASNSKSNDSGNKAVTASTSQSSSAADQLGSGWKWLTKGTWLPSYGAAPVPRDSTSAAAAVLAEDEKRKQEREKAAARAAAKAAAKAKKGKLSLGGGGADSETASMASSTNAAADAKSAAGSSGMSRTGEQAVEQGVGAATASAAAAAKNTADAAMAAATHAAANAQTGVLALRNRLAHMQFSLPTLVLTAVIAFLFGSLVRALLSPADFVLLPHYPYDHFDPAGAGASSSSSSSSSGGSAHSAAAGAGRRPNQAQLPGSSHAASAGSGADTQLSRLLQEVLGTFSSSASSDASSSSSEKSVQAQHTYGQEEMEKLLLKALQAGVNAGGHLSQHHQQQQQLHQNQHSAVRNVSWREIKRMIEIKGLMAGWDLVIAVVRR
ncbi:hypothetical protein OC835_006461 [Tilletia horrida]|nr:hypothetical protein OC835_006461 [Tilletia horrida]